MSKAIEINRGLCLELRYKDSGWGIKNISDFMDLGSMFIDDCLWG